MHKHAGWEKASSGMRHSTVQIFCFERQTVHIHITLNSHTLPLHSATYSYSRCANLPLFHKIQGFSSCSNYRYDFFIQLLNVHTLQTHTCLLSLKTNLFMSDTKQILLKGR